MTVVTLRQLRYFESLSRQLHFGRAARECAVTQPALSQQIQELEANLGASLVERGKLATSLTPTGLEIARRSRAVLASVKDLADYARHRASVLSGPLMLGVIPSIGPYLLPAILPELKRHYTELQLVVRESQTKNLLAALDEGRIDVALLALPVAAPPGLEQIALFDDPFHLLLPANHALSRTPRVRVKQLDGEKILLLEEGHCLRDQALSLCKRVGVEAFAEFGATSLATIVQLVSNGYGVTVLPEMALAIEADNHANLRVKQFELPQPARTIGLVWRVTSPRKVDFIELGRLVSRVHAVMPIPPIPGAQAGYASRARRLSR
jgi:LysR family hydrogen peroxide-inducible transcriptional activator